MRARGVDRRAADVNEWEAAGWVGIGRVYAGLCDKLPSLPAAGTPERAKSDAEHRAMCDGLRLQFERARGAQK